MRTSLQLTRVRRWLRQVALTSLLGLFQNFQKKNKNKGNIEIPELPKEKLSLFTQVHVKHDHMTSAITSKKLLI